jgi:hypothetical protein
MIDGESLRGRVLTILGAGLLLAGPACGSSAETAPGTSGSAAGQGGASGGEGGSTSVAATSGGGAYGTAGHGVCDPGIQCYTRAELELVLSTGGSGDGSGAAAPGAAGDSTGSAGASDDAGASGAQEVSSCLTLDVNMSYHWPSGFTLLNGLPLSPSESSVAGGQVGECCYHMQFCHSGRPFTVAGTPRTAPHETRADWTAGNATPATAALEPSVRAALARAWLDDALAEHASIASFARLTLELMQHGAPADLIEQSQRASLDEVRHARACFELAERYAGVAQGPGKFPLDTVFAPVELAQLASRTVHEGCVGETLAALIAAEQAVEATEPSVRALLETIAEDEARHAEFAWRVVRWALNVGGPETRAAVSRAFEQNGTHALPEIPSNSGRREALTAHGQLSHAERAAVAARGLREVVAPCARALLHGGQ